MTIVEAANRLRESHTTSVDLVEGCLDAIARLNDTLNAFITVAAADARRAAQHADQRRAHGVPVGPLEGIPVSVKDLIDVEGLPTTAASRARPQTPAAGDATVVVNLRRAGAIVIGKCNLHEFAFGTTGEESAFGPTRNPLAPSHMAGGSSSGSAVSVAVGMSFASVGTDTGGSIRIPSAACGVVGLKPAFGELSCDGVFPLAPTLDHVGPIGLSVDDVSLVYQAMAGRAAARAEPGERRSSPVPVRVGLPERYFLELVDGEVRDRFDAAVDRMRSAGAVVDSVEIPHAAEIRRAYLHTQLSEAASIHRKILATHADAYSPGLRQRLEAARSVTDEDYARAQRMREILREEVDVALGDRGALLLPTLPIPAPELGTREVILGGEARDLRTVMLRLTQLFNLTGHPAISIPCGVTSAGLPCGSQLVGHRERTSQLLDLASRVEGAIRGTAYPS